MAARDKIREVLLTVQLTDFKILGVADGGFGLEYKTGKMAAHIFRTEVKNEWGYSSTFSVRLLELDRNKFAFCLLQHNVRVRRLLYGCK
jgi:hypothetical protein